MTNPLVSVITPAYNCERYIGACIKSVQAQTFANWEMVVVDDGSTDETFNRALAIASVDDRIAVHRHPDGGNHGVSASRNLAIANSRATLLTFLDADDEWLPKKLEWQLSGIESIRSADLLYAKATCVDAAGSTMRHPDWPTIDWVLGHAPRAGRVDAPFDSFVDGRIGIPTLTVLARKAAVVGAGGFPTGLKFQVEDAALWGMMLRSGSAFFDDRVLARYRVHRKNFTSNLDALGTINSYWELFSLLAKTCPDRQSVLSDALLGCIGRYFSDPCVPLRKRFRCGFARARTLVRESHRTWPEVTPRVSVQVSRALVRRASVHLRRKLGIGPEPWRSILLGTRNTSNRTDG
jgi:glycosyltransferase involved in cell wall biosynthesis